MFCAEMWFPAAKSDSLVRLLIRCCLLGAYWLTSSAPASGLSDVIEYRIVEGRPAKTLIGNVPVDAGLHTMYKAQTLTLFRYRLLSTGDGSFAILLFRIQ